MSPVPTQASPPPLSTSLTRVVHLLHWQTYTDTHILIIQFIIYKLTDACAPIVLLRKYPHGIYPLAGVMCYVLSHYCKYIFIVFIPDSEDPCGINLM